MAKFLQEFLEKDREAILAGERPVLIGASLSMAMRGKIYAAEEEFYQEAEALGVQVQRRVTWTCEKTKQAKKAKEKPKPKVDEPEPKKRQSKKPKAEKPDPQAKNAEAQLAEAVELMKSVAKELLTEAKTGQKLAETEATLEVTTRKLETAEVALKTTTQKLETTEQKLEATGVTLATVQAEADRAKQKLTEMMAENVEPGKLGALDFDTMDFDKLSPASRNLVQEAHRYRGEAYKFRMDAVHELSEAQLKNEQATQALAEAETLRKKLEQSTPESMANAELAKARNEAAKLKKANAELRAKAEAEAKKIREQARREAEEIRARATNYRVALWRKTTHFVGDERTLRKHNGQLASEFLPERTCHKQNVARLSVMFRSAEQGGVLALAEVMVLLKMCATQWQQEGDATIGTLEVVLLRNDGRTEQALSVLLPNGSEWVESAKMTTEEIVKQSVRSAAKRLSQTEKDAKAVQAAIASGQVKGPEPGQVKSATDTVRVPAVGACRISQQKVARQAWLKIESGYLIVSFAAKYKEDGFQTRGYEMNVLAVAIATLGQMKPPKFGGFLWVRRRYRG